MFRKAELLQVAFIVLGLRTVGCGRLFAKLNLLGYRGHSINIAPLSIEHKPNQTGATQMHTQTHDKRQTAKTADRATGHSFFRSDQRKCAFIWGKYVIAKYCSYKAPHLNPSSMRNITWTCSVCVWRPECHSNKRCCETSCISQALDGKSYSHFIMETVSIEYLLLVKDTHKKITNLTTIWNVSSRHHIY